MSDVARLAGVSMKTVSRVFNNEKYVSDDKKEAILKVAAELNYQPLMVARGLASGRSYMIGLFVDDPSGDYVSKVMRGLLKACDKAGNQLVVQLLRDPEDISKVRHALASVRFDGVVLPPPICDNMAVIDALRDSGIPTARIGPEHQLPDMHDVNIDDYKSAYEMTQYLLDQGHRRIGLIKGDPSHACSARREHGFRTAMRDHGAAVDEGLVVDGMFSLETGRKAAERLLSGPTRPTAIFASNDEMAAGVFGVAQRHGLSVPGDLSIAGFDDDVIASIVSPALTTVRQPVEAMAETAHALITRGAPLDAAPAAHTVLPFEILIRDSVRKLA